MINKSGLKPLGRAVLVQPYEPEFKNLRIEIPAHVRANTALADSRCIIVEVGENCWHDEPSPRAKVGDKVLVTKYAGFMAQGTADGKQYRLVNDRDIFCCIVEEISKQQQEAA